MVAPAESPTPARMRAMSGFILSFEARPNWPQPQPSHPPRHQGPPGPPRQPHRTVSAGASLAALVPGRGGAWPLGLSTPSARPTPRAVPRRRRAPQDRPRTELPPPLPSPADYPFSVTNRRCGRWVWARPAVWIFIPRAEWRMRDGPDGSPTGPDAPRGRGRPGPARPGVALVGALRRCPREGSARRRAPGVA